MELHKACGPAPNPYPEHVSIDSTSLVGLRDAIASRGVSAEEAARQALGAVKGLNPSINALVQVFEQEAIEGARAIDVRLGAHESVGPLAGVPIVLKDNICLSWGKTT